MQAELPIHARQYVVPHFPQKGSQSSDKVPSRLGSGVAAGLLRQEPSELPKVLRVRGGPEDQRRRPSSIEMLVEYVCYAANGIGCVRRDGADGVSRSVGCVEGIRCCHMHPDSIVGIRVRI